MQDSLEQLARVADVIRTSPDAEASTKEVLLYMLHECHRIGQSVHACFDGVDTGQDVHRMLSANCSTKLYDAADGMGINVSATSNGETSKVYISAEGDWYDNSGTDLSTQLSFASAL